MADDAGRQREPGRAFCVTCGNLHATEAHAQCAANEARGLHADGVDPTECEHSDRDPVFDLCDCEVPGPVADA